MPNKTCWSSILKSYNGKKIPFWKIYWSVLSSLSEVTWMQATWNLKGPSKCAVMVSSKQELSFQAIWRQVTEVETAHHDYYWWLIICLGRINSIERRGKVPKYRVSVAFWITDFFFSLCFYLFPCRPWVLVYKIYFLLFSMPYVMTPLYVYCKSLLFAGIPWNTGMKQLAWSNML